MINENKKAIEVLEKILKQGHGGGNWRKLIMWQLEILKNNK